MKLRPRFPTEYGQEAQTAVVRKVSVVSVESVLREIRSTAMRDSYERKFFSEIREMNTRKQPVEIAHAFRHSTILEL